VEVVKWYGVDKFCLFLGGKSNESKTCGLLGLELDINLRPMDLDLELTISKSENSDLDLELRKRTCHYGTWLHLCMLSTCSVICTMPTASQPFANVQFRVEGNDVFEPTNLANIKNKVLILLIPSDKRVSLANSFMVLNERSHSAVQTTMHSTARRSSVNFSGTCTDELSKKSLNPSIAVLSSSLNRRHRRVIVGSPLTMVVSTFHVDGSLTPNQTISVCR